MKDGSFWLQMAYTEEPPFVKMVENLQAICQDEPPTPVFLSTGQVCAAQFSEDRLWYRGKVEDIVKNKVSMVQLSLSYNNFSKV